MADNNDITIVLVLIAILVFAYGGTQGWYGGQTIINQDTINQLDDAQITASSECSISLSKTTACVGEEVDMNIKDGVNTNCLLYFKYDGGGSPESEWNNAGVFSTDMNGDLELSRAAEYAGDYRFIAVCGSCVTNFADININLCGEDAPPDGEDGEDDVPPEDEEDEVGPFEEVVCGSTWPPAVDQRQCSLRSGCAVGTSCNFFPATIVAPAKCACTIG